MFARPLSLGNYFRIFLISGSQCFLLTNQFPPVPGMKNVLTELFNACRSGNLDSVKSLVQSNGNVCINELYALEGGYKQPPIFIAALNGHRALIEWIVSNTNVSLDTTDSDGENVFGVLARYGIGLNLFSTIKTTLSTHSTLFVKMGC